MSIIELPYPSPDLNPNKRLHWAKKAKAVKLARAYAYLLTKQSRIRPEPGLIPLRVTFFAPDKRRRDDDNSIAGFKAYRDGMAQAWGVDDSCFRPSYHFAEPIKGGKVCVEVL